MAGGSFGPAGVAKDIADQFQGKVTSYVIISCITAAVGGSIFGYDIGMSGFDSASEAEVIKMTNRDATESFVSRLAKKRLLDRWKRPQSCKHVIVSQGQHAR